MKQPIFLLPTALLACLLGILPACDDGRIYPETPSENQEGRVLKLSTRLLSPEAWPQAYDLVLAGFSSDNPRTPIVSKSVPRPDGQEQSVELLLPGIPEEVSTASLCLLSKGHTVIHHFYSVDAGQTDTIRLQPEAVDLASESRVQEQIFTPYCAQCHGAGEYAAAGLRLTEGYSHASLVGQTATLSASAQKLVQPAEPQNSFICQVLSSDILRYNHTDVLPEAELLTLIEAWISRLPQSDQSATQAKIPLSTAYSTGK